MSIFRTFPVWFWIGLSVLCSCPVARAVTNGVEPDPADKRFDAVCAFSRARQDFLPSNNSFGSGTLIRPDVVLIAAHLISEKDSRGRVLCDPSFDFASAGAPFAVRFRRRVDGGLGSNEQGAASFHDVLVSRIERAPGCPDIALAFLAAPVTHIQPMAVSYQSELVVRSKLTIAGWGYDDFGQRGSLRTGHAQVTRFEPAIGNLSWYGPSYGALYDSGGAVLVVEGCDRPALVGVINTGSSATLVTKLSDAQRLLAVATSECTPPLADPPPSSGGDGGSGGGGGVPGPPLPPQPEPFLTETGVFPRLTGGDAVARMTVELSDPSRSEPFTRDKKDVRRISLMIWYPGKVSPVAPRSSYSPQLAVFAKLQAAQEKRPFAQVLSELGSIHPRSRDFIEFAGTSMIAPVVLLEHDIGRSPEQYASLAEELACHGFVVVGINHTFDSVAATALRGTVPGFVDAPVLKTRADLAGDAMRGVVERWVADTTFVIGQLDALNRGGGGRYIIGHLNLLRIAVIGHGVGGAAAAALCARDPRVMAGINIDGSIFTHTEAVQRPFMVVQSLGAFDSPDPTLNPSSVELRRMKLKLPQYLAWAEEVLRQRAALDLAPLAGGVRVTIDGAAHDDFCDTALYGVIGQGATPVRTHEVMNAYVLAFVQRHLRGEHQSLLRGPSALYPEAALIVPEP